MTSRAVGGVWVCGLAVLDVPRFCSPVRRRVGVEAEVFPAEPAGLSRGS